MTRLQHFLRDESGTTTVEWVALTAVTIGMAIASTNVIKGGVAAAGQDIGSSINDEGYGQEVRVQTVYDEAFLQEARAALELLTLEEMTTLTGFIDDLIQSFVENPDMLSEAEVQMFSDFNIAVDLTWQEFGVSRPVDAAWTQEAIDALPGEMTALSYTN